MNDSRTDRSDNKHQPSKGGKRPGPWGQFYSLVTPNRTLFRKQLGNLLLIFTSILVILLLSEIAARVLLPSKIGTPWQYRVPHRTLGWSLLPDIEYLYLMPETNVLVRHNTQGFHDEEWPSEIAPSATADAGTSALQSKTTVSENRRILVLGDSFMEGYSVALEETFHRQLEQRLQSEGIEASVLNFGVGGYGTLQEILLYNERGAALAPDVVLLGFYLGNDFRNNLLALEQTGVKASNIKVTNRPFVDEIDGSEMTLTPVDYTGALQRYEAAKAAGNPMWKQLRQVSRLADLAGLVTDRRALQLKQRADSSESDTAAHQAARDLVKTGMHYCQPNALFEQSYTTTRQLLKELKHVVHNSGARLVVFSVPALLEVELDRWRKVQLNMDNGDAVCMEQAPGYAVLANILAEQEIDYIDLLPPFRAQASSVDSNGPDSDSVLYRYSDKHWSPAGHSLAAQVVAGNLIERLH